MLISYRWLGRHVDLDGLSPEDVVQDLTIHTAEVEGLELPGLRVEQHAAIAHKHVAAAQRTFEPQRQLDRQAKHELARLAEHRHGV